MATNCVYLYGVVPAEAAGDEAVIAAKARVGDQNPATTAECIRLGQLVKELLDRRNKTVAEGLLAALRDRWPNVVVNCQAEPYQSQDPQVVQGWAVAHQNVVRAAADTFGTVLPMAFDMIVRGAALRSEVSGSKTGGGAVGALREWLGERRERFTGLLDRLAGTAEYGVQVLWDPEAVAASLVESDDELRRMREEVRDKPKGLAHLLGQKLAKAVRAAMERQADLFAQDFYARIRRCVEDVRVDKLKKGDAGTQMLLNLSCLMAEGRGDLGRVLDDIQRTQGISVRFTGPWPPYSFVGG